MTEIDTSNWHLSFDADEPRLGSEGIWWVVDSVGAGEVIVAEVLEFGEDLERHKARAEFILRACKSHKALKELAEAIQSIRDEQTSDQIFGGQTTNERRSSSQIYASRISAESAKIDDLLAAVFPEPEETDETSNETR